MGIKWVAKTGHFSCLQAPSAPKGELPACIQLQCHLEKYPHSSMLLFVVNTLPAFTERQVPSKGPEVPVASVSTKVFGFSMQY